MSSPSAPIKVSFSFYPADVAKLNTLVVGLRRLDMSVRGGTVLRALIHLSPPTEMFAHSVLLAKAYGEKEGPREDDMVAGHPTVDLTREQVKKLDDVVTELGEKGVISTRAFVVRAVLRAAPDAKALAPIIRKFVSDFPRRPRGSLTHLAR